jgi:hypothetical protein
MKPGDLTVNVHVRFVFSPWWFRFTPAGRKAKWAMMEIAKEESA